MGKKQFLKAGQHYLSALIIERFSEDIDLVVLRREGESANQLKNKLKKVTEAVSEKLDDVEIDGITKKLGMIRKIGFF